MNTGYKKEISQYLENAGDIFFYRKGRVALYAILKAMAIGRGDEVILQAFTCVVVPNAIKYLGAKPVYVDICPDSFNMDTGKLREAINGKTRAIICQNTFGLSTGLEKIGEIAKANHLFTVEDCAHGFGGMYRGRPNGVFCDASFFSTQWNKPFSTGIGGFALVNDPGIAVRMQALEQEKLKPSFSDELMIRTLLLARRHILTDHNYWFLLRLYRRMSKYNLVTGSSKGEEITGVIMPSRYFMDLGTAQEKEGLRSLKQFGSMAARRKANAAVYSDFLKNNNKTYVAGKFIPDHSFLKYPLLVRNREDFFRKAEKEKIRLGDWFVSPLHPVTGDLAPWDFNKVLFPVASEISSRMVNLPTETMNPEKVVTFLEKNLESVY